MGSLELVHKTLTLNLWEPGFLTETHPGWLVRGTGSGYRCLEVGSATENLKIIIKLPNLLLLVTLPGVNCSHFPFWHLASFEESSTMRPALKGTFTFMNSLLPQKHSNLLFTKSPTTWYHEKSGNSNSPTSWDERLLGASNLHHSWCTELSQ